jgi:PAS domain S-box-containing protein
LISTTVGDRVKNAPGDHVRPAIVRYGYAVLVVVVALGAALALRSFDLEGFLFVIAVPVAVWLGGRGPGVVAIILSAVVLHFVFIAPTATGAMLPSYGYFVVFSVLAVLVTVLSEARHRAEQSLVHARDELEANVQERTAELERSNRQLRTQTELLRLAHDAVIVRNHDGRISFWNRGAEEVYGWPAAEAVGETSHQLLHTTFPIPRDDIEAVTREQGRWEGELVHRRRDGATVIVASRWSQLCDERGLPIAILEINRDVTDRKHAEEQLRTTQTELAHVTRVTTLGEVTASFAHEVNQPLAAIANNANACLALLSSEPPDVAEIRAALGDITSDADRASAVIERVRALARRSPLERLPLRLEDIVTDVVALTASEAAARRVTVRVDVGHDLPVVSGDRVQLQQVLLNLVVNGMDAMGVVPEPERLLEISTRWDGTPVVTIRVQDRGVGLDPAQVERLFEAFYTTKPKGMGMGLAISRTIIALHGGRLWAEPNQGSGATFSFSVPAVDRG